MERLRNILVCALLAALIVGVVYGILCVRAATATVSALPGEMRKTRQALAAEIDKQASGIRGDAADQLASLRRETLARVDALSAVVDARAGQALQIADARLSGAQGALEGIRADIKPTLIGTAALATDFKDSWDDLYWDVKASVESGTVTMHSVAVASEAVAAAAPKLADSSVGVGKSVDGIAQDVHKATSDFVAPRTFWQKFRAWAEAAGKIAARFL